MPGPVPRPESQRMHGTSYSAWMLGAILLSGWYWFRTARRDPRLPWIFIGGLVAAFIGAKLVYLLAEGWRDLALPDTARRLATGKTILGGLLFGYAGVEWTKRALDYRATTGDRFAIVVPAGLFLGRLGCLSHGCCLGSPCDASAWFALTGPDGTPRWPVVPAELAFHALAATTALALARSRTRLLEGQRFHAYLVAYGLFRFATEFLRETPRIAGPFTGYHLAAIALITLGIVRALQRHQPRPNTPPPR